MNQKPRIPRLIWRVMGKLNRGMLLRYKANSRLASNVLILTTTGRKSGLPRSTPLRYELVDGVYYVGSARGVQADWYRNLQACPQVNVRVGGLNFQTIARLITDPEQVADFIEIRLKRHPRFMGIMLRLEGLPRKPTRTDFETFSKRLAIVALQHPNPQ